MKSKTERPTTRPALGIATRLSLWITPLAIAIFVINISANYLLSRQLLESYIQDLTQTTTALAIRKIEPQFLSVANDADILASLIPHTSLSRTQIDQSIKTFLHTNNIIYGMTVALKPNTLIPSLGEFSPYYYRNGETLSYADLASESYRYLNQAWYKNTEATRSAQWSEPYLDQGGGNVLMTTYSTPVFLADGSTFAGVATADIELSWLENVVKKLNSDSSGIVFIVSKNDVVLAHSNPEYKMKKLVTVLNNRVIRKNREKYQESKNSHASLSLRVPCRDREGMCWTGIESLGDTGWKVVIVLPESELTATINRLTIKMAALALVGILLLLFIVVSASRLITEPLSRLAISAREIGHGNLETPLPAPLHDDETGSLTHDLNAMRLSLKEHINRIREATAKQQKLESEIQIAKEIQMSMIPGSGHVTLDQPGFSLYAFLRPARTVGGDLYYYQHEDCELSFIIGDVSDKGVPAALFMAKTVTLYTRALKEKLTPARTLGMMNDVLTQNNDNCMFVTAICGKINLENGRLLIANAGHMNPLVQNSQSTAEYRVDGASALGLIEGTQYKDNEYQLDHASRLFMYTDGISEAHDIHNHLYTDEKLHDHIKTVTSRTIHEAGNSIIQSVDRFSDGTPQFDDITLFIIQFR